MPKLTLKKTTEDKNNQLINEATLNEIDQIVEGLLDMLAKRVQSKFTRPSQGAPVKPTPTAAQRGAAVQKSLAKKGLAPTSASGGPVMLDQADFRKIANDLKNFHTGMKSLDALGRNLVAISKKNKALEPIAKSTVETTAKIIPALVTIVKQISTSIRLGK